IRDAGDGKTGIFEGTCCAHQARRCEISFRRRHVGAKESTHERGGENHEARGELAHAYGAAGTVEEGGEESPASVGRSDEIERKLTERESIDFAEELGRQEIAELAPAFRMPDVHQRFNS